MVRHPFHAALAGAPGRHNILLLGAQCRTARPMGRRSRRQGALRPVSIPGEPGRILVHHGLLRSDDSLAAAQRGDGGDGPHDLQLFSSAVHAADALQLRHRRQLCQRQRLHDNAGRMALSRGGVAEARDDRDRQGPRMVLDGGIHSLLGRHVAGIRDVERLFVDQLQRPARGRGVSVSFPAVHASASAQPGGQYDSPGRVRLLPAAGRSVRPRGRL